MANIKKFNEFVNEGLTIKDSISSWGDEIIKMLHNNNDELVHGLFKRFANELKGMPSEEATNKFKELTGYIQSSNDSPSFFPNKTAEHFLNMYLKK